MPDGSRSAPELRRFLAQVFVPICGLILATIAALTASELWSARETNRMAAVASRELAQTGFDLTLQRLGTNVLATAVWDDAVLMTNNRIDEDWVTDNLANWAKDWLHFEMTFILGPDDGTRFAMIEGRVRSVGIASVLGKEVQALIDRVRAAPLGEPVTGLARAGGRLAMVGAAAIRPHTDGLMPIAGGHSILVYADLLDETVIDQMRHAYLLKDLALVEEQPRDAAVSLPLGTGGTPVAYLTWNPDRPGSRLLSITLPVIGTVVVAIGLLATAIYLHAQRAAAALMLSRHLALTDHLTGLPNRFLLKDRLEQALAGATRSSQAAVLFIDLDGFKAVNDRYGHSAGDELLKEVATRFQSLLRPADTLARIGGDEFVIVQAPADETSAARTAERLLRALEAPILLSGGAAEAQASIGIAVSATGERPSDLLRRADTALYAAKHAGKGRCRVAEPPPPYTSRAAAEEMPANASSSVRAA